MVIASRCSSNLLRLDLSGSAPSDNPDDSIDDAGMIYSLFIKWIGVGTMANSLLNNNETSLKPSLTSVTEFKEHFSYLVGIT